MDLTNNLIAITGGTGSLGSLLPSDCIRLKTRLEDNVEKMYKELVSINPKPKVLMHLAARTQTSLCEKDPEGTWKINVDGGCKWYEASYKAGILRFIFTSTSHVFKPLPKDQYLDINSATEPVNVYGKSKLAAEKELLKLSHNSSCELRIARLFSTLAPKGRPDYLLPALERRAINKDFSPVPGLNYYRDFLPIEETAHILLQYAKKEIAPKLVLICSGKPKKIADLAKEVFAKHGLNADALLTQAPKSATDVEWTVGIPTKF